MADQDITDFLKSLPSLVNCENISKVQTEKVRQMIVDSGDSISEDLENLESSYTKFSIEDSDKSILEELQSHSGYLSQTETSFKTDWSEKSMENQSFLINAVSSVCFAATKFAKIRENLRSIIIWYCPSACFMTSQELDEAWEGIHTTYNLFIADLCASTAKELHSISKDSLLDWSDKWIDILLESLAQNTLEFAKENPAFNPYLFTAIKLFSLAGRLDRQCQDLHVALAPRVLPALKAFLSKCPQYLDELDIIGNLIAKKPESSILSEIWHTYSPDKYPIDHLKKRAKHFITQYTLLSDDLERYLSFFNFKSEVFLLQDDETFDLAEYERQLNEIEEAWDCGLELKLRIYLFELDFLSICERFQLELARGREFLSKYECGKYEDFNTLNRHKKEIHDFTFSGLWLDSREDEKNKLSNIFDKIREQIFCEDEDVVIFDIDTGDRLMKMVENDFNDFTNLHETVQEYYEMGIRQWKDFLEDSRYLEESISKKSYLLSKGFVKFESADTFSDSVRKVRIEMAELEHFSEARDRLQILGDEICGICKGESQQLIQSKLRHFSEKIEEMKLQASDAYGELDSRVPRIIELSEILTKVEEIVRETQEKIDLNLDDFKKAKPVDYMDYLISRLYTLKVRTKKLPMIQEQLQPLLKIDSLDISQLESRCEVVTGNLSNLLEFLSKKLEKAILTGIEKANGQIGFGDSNFISYRNLFQDFGTDSSDLRSNNLTKKLHDLENFFCEKYFDDILNSMKKLEECSKVLQEDDIKSELSNLEESFAKLELSVRSMKIFMHFAITYQELDGVLKLRETFIETSSRPSYIADRIEFISNQIDEFFGEDFNICKKYYTLLRNRYNEYLCEENQPQMLPLSLEIVSKLESRMRERLDQLEKSFSHFNEIFREYENTVKHFRKESQNILAFVDKLEAAFQQKGNSIIRDSDVLATQCQSWELLIIEGQKSLTQYDQSFEAAEAIYEQLSPSPKVISAKARFPKAKEYLDQLRACLNLYQKYQSDLKGIEDRLSALTNDFSHFYTDMRFPSASTNGLLTEEPSSQTPLLFKNEIQSISESVRSMRLGITELHGGAHQVVEYSINEEKRLKALEDKLPEWKSKINDLIEECTHTSLVNNSISNLNSSNSEYNGHFSLEIISEDSGNYNLSLGGKENPLSEEERKIEQRLERWRRWLKKKQKSDIMQSDISIKLSEAQIQKREIEIVKAEFEKKRNDFQLIPSNKEALSNSILSRLFQDVKVFFTDFEILISKRCEDTSNKVSALLEFHLLISLSEKRLTCIQTDLTQALDPDHTLQEQMQHIYQLRTDLKECQTECVEKLSVRYGYLIRDSNNNFLPVERSPELSDSLSESDTDEKMQSISHSSNETSSLLSPIPCLEQIQSIETKHRDLSELTSEHIDSRTHQEETARELFQKLLDIRSRIGIIHQDISQPDNTSNFKLEYTNLTEEINHIDLLYTRIEASCALTREELQLRHEVAESIDSLKYTIHETSPFHEMAGEECDSIVPIKLEYIFEPNNIEPSVPLLLPTEIPSIHFVQENDSGEHATDSPIKNCFAAITEAYNFYIQFTVAGPHAEISEEEIVTVIKDKYTQTHTIVVSILNNNPDPTGYAKQTTDSWLDVLRNLRTTLVGQISDLRETWLGLEERYDELYSRISELESEYAAFCSREGERDLDFEIEVNMAQEHHEEAIENYNTLSPEMYQLVQCQQCQDDICQTWNEKLDSCRRNLQRLKCQFADLLDSNPIDDSPHSSPPPNQRVVDSPVTPLLIPTAVVATATKETNTEPVLIGHRPSIYRHFLPICIGMGSIIIICVLTWYRYTRYLYNHPADIPK